MIKKTVAVVLFLVMCFSAVGCDGNAKNKDADLKLWSALATTKVLRDVTYDDTAEAELKYEMCRNEIEGAQFIITPQNGYKVVSFDVTVSDLVGPNGAKIGKDAIKIYLQKYINVYSNTTGNPKARTGYHPDALLPFDKAAEYGENKIDGVNQAVYITVETEKDTVAGEYTGTATLTAGGKNFEIPMKVTVWDFAISDEVHVKSLFDVWTDQLVYGELDCSDEMKRAYNDALLKYRVNGNRLVYNDLDEYVAEAKKATADPRVTTYVIPYRGAPNSDPDCGLGGSLDFDYHMQWLSALAENSTEELCLLDKLVYYFGALYDEPQFDATGVQDKQIVYVTKKLEELHAKLYSDLETKGYFDDKSSEYKQHFLSALNNIPNIVTGPYNEKYVSGLNTYCPLFDEFHSEEDREIYATEREKNGNLFWYGCTGPNYPFITYHIDDNLVGARILDYMMYDYGIDGNLYWCVNYSLYGEMGNNGNITRPINQYEEVRRDSRTDAINGDGYLFYPGVDYGIKGPVGTIRLEAVRDGNEEYEYLYELDRLAGEISEYYGEKIDANEIVSSLYRRLYSGVQYVPNEENYFQVRRELAETIGLIGSEEKFVSGGITYNGANAEISFYAADGYDVKVNGTTVAGTVKGAGRKYSYAMSLDKPANYFDIELTKDGEVKKHSFFVGGKTAVASDFDTQNSVGFVRVNDTDAISVSYATDVSISGGAAKVEMVSKFDIDDPLATMTYYPEISFDADEIGFTIKDLDRFTVMVYNASEADIETVIYLGAGSDTYELTTQKLAKGKWTAVTLDNVYLTNWRRLSMADKIIFRFSNTVKDENKEPMFDQIVYFDNMLVGAVVPG